MKIRRVFLRASLALLILAGGVLARDWGFSKDSLFEWRAQGDSVQLVNQGGLLRFDSILIEVIRAPVPTLEHVDLAFRIPPAQYPSKRILYFQKGTGGVYAINKNQLPGGNVSQVAYADSMQSILMWDFDLDSYNAVLPKAFASEAFGDTLMARLIFSVMSRGKDTLIISGIYRGGVFSPIFLGPRKSRAQGLVPDKFFDLRGRRMDPVFPGLKTSRTPVVSKE